MARLISEATFDFSNGMWDSTAPARYPKAACRLIVNGRIQSDGSVQRRSGSIRTSSAVANAAIGYGGSAFTTAGGTDQMIVILGKNAYSSTNYGATLTSIATGLREDYYSFATMRVGATNYLLMANGDTTIKRWDGTTWDTLPNAPSGVKYIAEFNRRLYATGHSGVLVQASAVGDPTTWATASGGLTVQTTQTPTGMYQIGPHLLVFDRDSTSYIDGFGEQTLVVAAGATGFSRSVGCVAFRSIVGIGDNGCAWLSKRGVEYYTPGSNITLLTKSVQVFIESLDWDKVYTYPGRPSATYDAVNQNYHLAVSVSGDYNNRTLVLNVRQRDVEYQRQGTTAAAAYDTTSVVGSGGILFGVDVDGYLVERAGGYGMEVDSDGYWTFDSDFSGDGYEGTLDSDGYLVAAGNAGLPSTLFVAPSSSKPVAVYSLGYDGWVRRHSGVNSDDMASAGTGGSAVTMTIRTRPFFQKMGINKKRSRVVRVSSIQTADATVSVAVYGRGVSTSAKSLTMTALGSDHAHRKQTKTHLDADAPQVELSTSDDVKVTMLGLDAQILRTRV